MIPFKMINNMSMLRHGFSNGLGGGAFNHLFSYSVKVCIYGMTPKVFDMVKKSKIWFKNTNNNEKEKMKYYKLLFIFSHNMSYPAICLLPLTYIVSEYYLFAVLSATLSRQVTGKIEVQSPKLVSKFSFN